MTNIFNDLNDTKLIEKFAQGSNQLLANSYIRLENVGSMSQLVSYNGEIIAIMYLNDHPRIALIKNNSTYRSILDEQLTAKDFVLVGDAKKAGYSEYKQYVTPAGYQLYYTDPAILWKKWWPTERFYNKQRFNMNILVSIKDNWYPVQNISVHEGVFTIKTMTGQLSITKDEKILWIAQKNPSENSANPQQSETSQISNVPTNTHRSNSGISSSLPTNGSRGDSVQNPTAFLASNTTELIGSKSAIAPPHPSRELHHNSGTVNSLDQLQQLIETINQQKKHILNLEQKHMKAEHRAAIAEQRLHHIQQFLNQKGFDLKEIYGTRTNS
jgi:hypothetical protein